MEQVASELEIPVYADAKGKHPSDLGDNLLTALGDSGKNSESGQYGNESEQQMFVSHLLQVEPGWLCAKTKTNPWKKKADG